MAAYAALRGWEVQVSLASVIPSARLRPPYSFTARRRTITLVLCALALTACTPPASRGAAQSSIAVTEAYIPQPPNGAAVAGGYLTIANSAGEADSLIGVASPRAGRVEIHEMRMDGAMMMMRRVDAIAVPARGETRLAPGGYHLMIFDMPAPFVVGERVPVTLTFAHAGAILVEMDVRALGAGHESGNEQGG